MNLLEAALPIPQVQFAKDENSDIVTVSYGVVTAKVYSIPSAAADLKIGAGEKGFFSNFALEISKHRCWDRELEGLISRVAF